MGRVRDVALGCLRAGGFAHASLEDVAVAAGLPAADLTARYGDIEGLLAAVVEPLLDQLGGVARLAATADLAQEGEVRRVITAYVQAIFAHRALAPKTGPLFGELQPRPEPEGFIVDWQLGGAEPERP